MPLKKLPPTARYSFVPLPVAAALLLVLVGGLRGAENAAQSEARLRQSVTYLASDELEGRGVGTAGLDKAADYLAEQFAKAGLRTELYQGTPFQEFEVTAATELGPTSRNRLTLIGQARDGQPKRISLRLNEQFTPLPIGGSAKFEAPLVFVGYGITAKDLKRDDQPLAYDDYAGLYVQDKVVIIIRKEPQQKDPASPFDGTQNSQYARFDRKVTNAAEHGAAAVIFVNDGVELAKQQESLPAALKDSLDKLQELREKLATTTTTDTAYGKLVTEIGSESSQAAEAAKGLTAKGDVLLPFAGAGTATRRRNMPVYFCSRQSIDEVLRAAGSKDLATLEAEIDGNLAPHSVELPGWRAMGETNIVEVKSKVKNVVAVLEGSGPLADETIIVGAHYDHLGYGGDGSLTPWTTDIHNGADDNASGTAVLLEVARRLAATGEKPNRRIVFIAFTGEERGLLGSAHYTREPRFPLEKTVAMFNLDMVGRLRDDSLAVYGTGTAKEFDSLVERLAHEQGLKLSKHEGGFGPSDHNSFYAKKIPVLHLFTGNHSDYHRPSDDSDKLNIAGMRRIADFVVDAVHATDASTQRPAYVEIRRVEQLADATEGDRPSFGSMPAYPNPAPDGVLLEAVMEGTPADKAGIKGGDVLMKFGDSKITVLEDFESALRKHKPGDKVKVVVRRGKEMVEAEVTLARRRAMP